MSDARALLGAFQEGRQQGWTDGYRTALKHACRAVDELACEHADDFGSGRATCMSAGDVLSRLKMALMALERKP